MQSYAIMHALELGIARASRPMRSRASLMHLMREAIRRTQTATRRHQAAVESSGDIREMTGRYSGDDRKIVGRWLGDALLRVDPAAFGLEMELGMLDSFDGERRGGPWIAAVELGANRCEAVKVGELPVQLLALEVQRGHLRVLRERTRRAIR